MGRFLCGHKFSAHLGKHKGLQLLDLTVRLFCLSGTAKLSSKVAITMSSCCSTFTPAFGDVSILDFAILRSILVGCSDISLLFQFSFAWRYVMQNISSYSACHLGTFFGELYIKVFGLTALVTFLLLSFKSSTCILDSSPLCISCKYLLPARGLSSHSLDSVWHRVEVFNFSEIQLINSTFHRYCLNLVLYFNSHCHHQGHPRFAYVIF